MRFHINDYPVTVNFVEAFYLWVEWEEYIGVMKAWFTLPSHFLQTILQPLLVFSTSSILYL